MKPFQVFWETMEADDIEPHGIVARYSDGFVHAFSLSVYDVNTSGVMLDGGTATWSAGIFYAWPDCSEGPNECFVFTAMNLVHCECLPDGPRPGASNGSKVEVRCKPQ